MLLCWATSSITVYIAKKIVSHNPPYISATLFIEHALRLMSGGGKVAMLLRTDFDHAKTRRHLFSDCPAFACPRTDRLITPHFGALQHITSTCYTLS
jgi:hypothetical protein